MRKSEKERNRWALGASMLLSLMIFVGFGFYKGYITIGDPSLKPSGQVANAVSAKAAPSPIQNSKETLTEVFGEMGERYREFKETVSGVLVPFVTGIEVYERNTK